MEKLGIEDFLKATRISFEALKLQPVAPTNQEPTKNKKSINQMADQFNPAQLAGNISLDRDKVLKDSRELNAKDHREKRLSLYSPSKKFSEAKRAVKRRLNEIRYDENGSSTAGGSKTRKKENNSDLIQIHNMNNDISKLEPNDNFDSRMGNNS